jgi:hypothetical protein
MRVLVTLDSGTARWHVGEGSAQPSPPPPLISVAWAPRLCKP